MQYRRMGRSGLKLSEVAVGSWMTDLKGREACDTAKEVLRRAYNSGVNFFDCADAYRWIIWISISATGLIRIPVWRKLWKL